MAGQKDEKLHWVEDVFPAKFSITTRELLKKELNDIEMSDKELEDVKKKSLSVYDMVARRYAIYMSSIYSIK